MVYFRKRLTLDVLGKINEMIIARAQKPSRRRRTVERIMAMTTGRETIGRMDGRLRRLSIFHLARRSGGLFNRHYLELFQ
jgi:hypothetical protein